MLRYEIGFLKEDNDLGYHPTRRGLTSTAALSTLASAESERVLIQKNRCRCIFNRLFRSYLRYNGVNG